MKGVSISPRFFHLSVSFQSKYILIISGKMSNQGKISKLSDFCIIDTGIFKHIL